MSLLHENNTFIENGSDTKAKGSQNPTCSKTRSQETNLAKGGEVKVGPCALTRPRKSISLLFSLNVWEMKKVERLEKKSIICEIMVERL